MQQRYSVDVGFHDRQIVMRVTGEVDLATAPHLMDTILAVAQAHPGHPVVVDAEDLTFIDSSGLRALVLASGHLADLGSALRMVNAGRSVLRVMQITGVDDLLLDLAEVLPAAEHGGSVGTAAVG